MLLQYALILVQLPTDGRGTLSELFGRGIGDDDVRSSDDQHNPSPHGEGTERVYLGRRRATAQI